MAGSQSQARNVPPDDFDNVLRSFHEWMHQKGEADSSVVVRGNHDYAVGHCDNSRWSARFREVAEVTRCFTSSQLSGPQKAWLRSLPVNAQVERKAVRFI